MPTDPKPLFRPAAVRPHLAAFAPPPAASAARAKLANLARLLATPAGRGMKETELRDEFLYDVFRDLLGYTTPADGGPAYTFRKELFVPADGTFADAAFGRFAPADPAAGAVVLVLEGKGPRDPLDRPFAGRKRSAYEQALLYAVQLRCDWFLVTNLRETRLHSKRADQLTYERFETARLAADGAELARFVFLLGADRVVPPGGGPNHLDALLAESREIGRRLTADYYRDYRRLREETFRALCAANPDRPPAAVLTAAQKVLDRVLFVAFCEDRDLLPRGIIARAYRHTDPFHPRPVWQNFVALFRAVDKGSKELDVAAYNGELFKPDDFLDALAVPDSVCEGFKALADYEYGTDPADRLVDVEILGHIFEQSITDLEELHRAVTLSGGRQPPELITAQGADAPRSEPAAPSKRKKEGAFYTPDFVTRYVVAETLDPVLRERFDQFRDRYRAAAPKAVRPLLADPTAYDPAALTKRGRDALRAFWDRWIGELHTVRIVDPACGSGAFLIEAFDQMYAEYQRAQGRVRELGGELPYDLHRDILTHNLFGLDLNAEAVEIARLSCWIKTAEKGKKLTALDANIRRGNSVVAPDGRPPLEVWREHFPAALADGGFDVVVGNPPYVRQEWIKADKPYLERHYRAFDGAADLYVYFYELGLNLLRPGGRLGFVVTNKWMKAGYGEGLRTLYAEAAWVESVIDFGHARQIFPDADVFPSILVARKPDGGPPPAAARVCVIPRDQLRIDDLSRQIAETGASVPRSRLGAAPWSLEPPGVAALMDKLRATGVPLKEFAGVVPLYGIKTGFNDAFLIDTPTKERLVAADPKSEPLFRPYLRGQDLDRWRAEWSGLWMIALKSSANHPWPWAGAGDRAEDVFRQTYPALFVHFDRYRAELTKRQDQGEHWWELRACAYWDKFGAPKVMYQDITWNQRFCLDTAGTLCNNTVYFLPTADPWVLAVMNAPVSWWLAWRTAQHGKDEALRLFTEYLNAFPIPRPTEQARAEVDTLIARLIDLQGGRTSGIRALLDWLRAEFGVVKPTQKLAELVALDADGLIAEVRKARGRAAPLSVADVKRLTAEHAAAVAPLRALAREAAGLERRVSDAVNAAYGLTPAEVVLLWATAPPRMPLPPP